jgi:hypothetical protein
MMTCAMTNDSRIVHATLGLFARTSRLHPPLQTMTSRLQNNMDELDESESSSSDYDVSDAVGTGTIGAQGQGRQEEAVIASRETKVVLRFKFVVAAVLICTALGVALGVFYYVAGSENSQFEKKFRDDSVKIMDSIGGNVDRTLGIFDSIAVTWVSSARASGDEWPFVTIPNFGVRMSKFLAPSHSLAITILPIVTTDQREEWEEYSVTHDSWVNETIAVQDAWDQYYGPVVYDWKPNRVIFDDNGDIPYDESERYEV